MLFLACDSPLRADRPDGYCRCGSFVPGLLLLTGCSRARARASRSDVSRGDVIAVAQILALSMLWLPVLWSLGGAELVDR